MTPIPYNAIRKLEADIAAASGGGGGGAVKSAMLYWASKAQAGSAVPFTAADVIKDEIGLIVNPADFAHEVLLPKGYFAVSLLVNPLGFPDMGSASDEWTAGLSVLGNGFHAGDTFPPGLTGLATDYNFISGTLASLNQQALAIATLVESGDQDLHALGLVEHAFAQFGATLSVTDVTTGASMFQGTPGFDGTFNTQTLLQIVQLGSKT